MYLSTEAQVMVFERLLRKWERRFTFSLGVRYGVNEYRQILLVAIFSDPKWRALDGCLEVARE